MIRTEKFEKMPVGQLIIKMALPAMVSMIVQALYNIVDSMFVAKISEKALTALSLAFPIQIVIVAIFVGLGVGVNSYISRKLGEKNIDDAVNAAEHGIFLGIGVWTILAVSSFFIPKYFFGLFTKDPQILEYAIRYTHIVMLFSFGSIITEVCMNILRANGDMLSSMKIQLLGAGINIILDPVFIFGFLFIPAMGVTGAAIATVIGQISALIFGVSLVLNKKRGFSLSLDKFKFSKKITKGIFEVATPTMFMQLLGSVMLTGINFILSGYSATSLAVFGAYFKLQSFIFMPVFGINQGMMPVVGYNFGAKNFKRVISAIKYSALYATIIMLTGFVIFQLFPGKLLDVFSSSQAMKELGIPCLRIISLAFLFAGSSIVFSASFQALGKGSVSLFLSFARQIILLLPIAFILSKLIGLNGVWLSFPLSEIITFVLGFFLVIKTARDNLSEENLEKKYA